MVQIIQSQPTQRQSALEQALGQAVQGFGQSYLQGQQTLRQQALADKQAKAAKESQDLQLALGLLKEGYAPTADAKSILLGTAPQPVISPAMEAQPAQYAPKELAGPVRPGEQLGSTQEMIKAAQPARPEILGPRPELTYTAKKQAEMAAQRLKQEQENKLLQARLDAMPLDAQKRQLEMETARLQQQKLGEEMKNIPLQRQKLAAETRKLGLESTQGKAPTDTQLKAAGFAERAKLAEQELMNLPSGYGAQKSAAFTGAGLYPEVLKSEEQKLFEQAKNNFISANLRLESGAAISESEYANEERKYFPQPGDSAKVIEQKARARQQAIVNLQNQAGKRAASEAELTSVAGAPQGVPSFEDWKKSKGL